MALRATKGKEDARSSGARAPSPVHRPQAGRCPRLQTERTQPGPTLQDLRYVFRMLIKNGDTRRWPCSLWRWVSALTNTAIFGTIRGVWFIPSYEVTRARDYD